METRSIYRTPEGESEILSFYDEVLSHWPVPVQTRTIDTRHGHTFVISSGEASAPPLVLLHGAASNATSWVGQIARYAQEFRVYAVDIPGEPGRSTQNRPSWHGPGYAEWLEDLLDGLALGKTSLVGMSQGGWTAIRFAADHPARVEKLVLIAPGGIVPTRPSFILRALFYSFFGRAGGRKLNRIVLGGQALHPAAVRAMDLIMSHFRARIEKEYLFSDEELAALTMPACLIEGARDVIRSSGDAASRLGRWLPDLATTIIPDAGHCLVDVAERVIPFLSARERVVGGDRTRGNR